MIPARPGQFDDLKRDALGAVTLGLLAAAIAASWPLVAGWALWTIYAASWGVR